MTEIVAAEEEGEISSLKATKMRFSANCCFKFDDGADDKNCIARLEKFLLEKPSLALYGEGLFLEYLLKYAPSLAKQVQCILTNNGPGDGKEIQGIPIVSLKLRPAEIKTVFLCELVSYRRWRMKKNFSDMIEVLCADVLVDLDWSELPDHAWIPFTDCVYPLDIPDIEFLPGQDMILIDCPSRNLSFLPNGLGYVHNALKKTGIKFQTFDLDIVIYHRFHSHRLLDSPSKVVHAENYEFPEDPWQIENYDVWQSPKVVKFFEPDIEEIVQGVIRARPKILGLSLQACNISFSREVVKRVKAVLPETFILVGGYSCYQPSVGLLAFPECDYMIIGEADLTIGALVKLLAQGERPTGLPGVMSKFDPPEMLFKEGPMPEDLDSIEMPKYEWFDLNIYKNWNHYLLTPIIATRGCRWSLCTFCAERFSWRARSPKDVVDEFEWLSDQGCDLFMFNESDLNGKPEILLAICDEIIRRNLRVRLTGQLRIHKRSDRKFFDKLHEAGFVALRFGVDAWAKKPLRLQKKGYTCEMIYQNLKDCAEAGIVTEVNTVIGVPGETDQDIEESIELVVRCRPYINRVANINPLLFVIGSVYWEEPQKHNIHFRDDPEKLFKKYSTVIPSNLWYSTEPYIDENVRKERFQRVVLALHERGFSMGEVAEQVIRDVAEGRGAEAHARPGANQEKAFSATAVAPAWPEAQKKILSSDSEIDASSSEPSEKISDQEGTVPHKLVIFNNNFYRVKANSKINLEKLLEQSEVKKPGKLKGSFFLVRKMLLALKSPARIAYLGYRTLVVFRNEGFNKVLERINRRLRMNRHNSLMAGQKEITCDEELPQCDLIYEGFHKYNLVSFRGRLYGIKQGYEFDSLKIETQSYEPGILFTGKSTKEIEKLILGYLLRQIVIDVNLKQQLLLEDVYGYNIMVANGYFYAIKQGHELDLTSDESCLLENENCFKASSDKKILELVISKPNEEVISV